MGATWESNDTTHRASLRPVGDFKTHSFRKQLAASGVWMILGQLEAGNTTRHVQSFVFERAAFGNLGTAKRWLEDNKHNHEREYEASVGQELDNQGIKGIGGINKRLVSVQRAEGSDGGSGEISGVAQPDDDQLTKINQFTRTPKSAAELAVFPVLACNDLVDRDVDQFSTETVKDFAKLPGDLSPIGKSFLVGHDHHSLPVGRIFDGRSEKQGDTTWLKLWTYIPNTEQYKSYLENVDFGVYWAVSVGVMLNGAQCSIGEPHEWSWHPMLCSAGHFKGDHYDPSSTEVDDWGYPIATENGGELCWRILQGASDFYELSQVYLGAQYMAALDKGLAKSAGSGVSAVMGRGAINVLSLRTSEVEKADAPLSFSAPPGSPVAEAIEGGLAVERLPGGDFRWKDAAGLIWVFDSSESEKLCLGRSEEGVSHPSAQKVEELEEEPEALPESEENDDVDKAAVLAAATKAKLPQVVIERIQGADDNGLEAALVASATRIVDLEAQVSASAAKSALGERYVQHVRAEATHWYTMSQRDPALPEKGVNTDSFVRLLDLCGENVELIEEQTKVYKGLAQARFPEAVRRSSFPENMNERHTLQEIPDMEASANPGVRRIHG